MQTWTFGPAGIYTATWDGVSKVTVTLTAGGAFVASFFASSLTAAVASPEYQAILSPAPSANTGVQLVATTGVNGFALQNATPTILSWTAPNDGAAHRVLVLGSYLDVTSAETGGTLTFNVTGPDGGNVGFGLFTGGLGTGAQVAATISRPVKAGTTVSLVQTSALTAGAAILWTELWAS